MCVVRNSLKCRHLLLAIVIYFKSYKRGGDILRIEGGICGSLCLVDDIVDIIVHIDQ